MLLLSELKNDSSFDPLWRDFIRENSLDLCDQFVSSPINYTYCHVSLGQQKWNDHFLLSRNLVNDTSNHVILEDGSDPSDHMPIMMQIEASLQSPPVVEAASEARPKLKWDLCSEDETRRYTTLLDSLLSVTPSYLNDCHQCHCKNED